MIYEGKEYSIFIAITTLVLMFIFFMPKFYMSKCIWVAVLGLIGLMLGAATLVIENNKNFSLFRSTKNLNKVGVKDINSIRAVLFVVANNLCAYCIFGVSTVIFTKLHYSGSEVLFIDFSMSIFRKNLHVYLSLQLAIFGLMLFYDICKTLFSREKAITKFWELYNNNFEKNNAIELANKASKGTYLSTI